MKPQDFSRKGSSGPDTSNALDRPTIGVGSIRGSDSQVDYRLARRSILIDFRKGRVSRTDVCDAHPELIRAARNVGEPTSIECPFCNETNVVLVSFVFGDRLGPSGRCVTTRQELMSLRKSSQSTLTTYVVEVCPMCSWNHLTRMSVTNPIGAKARKCEKELSV